MGPSTWRSSDLCSLLGSECIRSGAGARAERPQPGPAPDLRPARPRYRLAPGEISARARRISASVNPTSSRWYGLTENLAVRCVFRVTWRDVGCMALSCAPAARCRCGHWTAPRSLYLGSNVSSPKDLSPASRATEHSVECPKGRRQDLGRGVDRGVDRRRRRPDVHLPGHQIPHLRRRLGIVAGGLPSPDPGDGNRVVARAADSMISLPVS